MVSLDVQRIPNREGNNKTQNNKNFSPQKSEKKKVEKVRMKKDNKNVAPKRLKSASRKVENVSVFDDKRSIMMKNMDNKNYQLVEEMHSINWNVKKCKEFRTNSYTSASEGFDIFEVRSIYYRRHYRQSPKCVELIGKKKLISSSPEFQEFLKNSKMSLLGY